MTEQTNEEISGREYCNYCEGYDKASEHFKQQLKEAQEKISDLFIELDGSRVQLQEERNAHSFWAKKSQELVNELKDADDLLFKLSEMYIWHIHTETEATKGDLIELENRVCEYLTKKGLLEKINTSAYKVKHETKK